MTQEQLIENIRQAVSRIIDPDFGQSLEKQKAVADIKVFDDRVEIYLELIPPIHWIAKRLDDAVQQVVKPLVSESCQIAIYVREQPTSNNNKSIQLPNIQNLIAIASGKGGVGKSTVAANLAAALAQKGARVGLLDADIYGPSQPTMFHLAGEQMQAEKQPNGSILGYPNERYGVKVASIGFVMERDQAAILRGPMLAGYFTTLVEQIQWGELDFLLFDLPPGTGDIQLTLTQRVPLTGAVIVTTPQEIALADVRRSIAMFKRVNVGILGIIENMSWFAPPEHPEQRYYIFGEGGGKQIAGETDSPFLGEIPLTVPTREGGDAGLPVVLNPEQFLQAEIIRDIAAQLVSQTRKANAALKETPTVQITL